jgi:hypothetical protein
MSLLTMTDCSDADNRVHARHELDRAVASSGYTMMSAWAMKWARPLLDYADAAPSEDEIDNAVVVVEAELNAAESERDNLRDTIEAAIKRLDAIEADDATIEVISEIVADLENSL